jgi:hypothetical protein
MNKPLGKVATIADYLVLVLSVSTSVIQMQQPLLPWSTALGPNVVRYLLIHRTHHLLSQCNVTCWNEIVLLFAGHPWNDCATIGWLFTATGAPQKEM